MRKLTLVVSVLILSGCVLAPVIDSVKKAGLVESDRQALLDQDIKRFTNQMAFGQRKGLEAFVAPERRNALGNELRKVVNSEKIIDSSVDAVTFSNDSFDADVKLRVKYYRVPVYVVDERLEQQHWVFSRTDGWQLFDRIPNG